MLKLKPRTRIQQRNRDVILEAALDAFSNLGFSGASLDKIASAAGLSKPNLLYYFPTKCAMHGELIARILALWSAPLRDIDPQGDPIAELLAYVDRKLEISRLHPRETRLFANEIVQGAPHMLDILGGEVKDLLDEKVELIELWVKQGKIADVPANHLFFSIWSMTQHYADFDVQVGILMAGEDPYDKAPTYLRDLFTKLLTP